MSILLKTLGSVILILAILIIILLLIWFFLGESKQDKKKDVLKVIWKGGAIATFFNGISLIAGVTLGCIISLSANILSSYNDNDISSESKTDWYTPFVLLNFYVDQYNTKKNLDKTPVSKDIDLRMVQNFPEALEGLHFVIILDKTKSSNQSEDFNRKYKKNKLELIDNINDGCSVNPADTTFDLNELILLSVLKSIINSDKTKLKNLNLSIFVYNGDDLFSSLNQFDLVTDYVSRSTCTELNNVSSKLKITPDSDPNSKSHFENIFRKIQKSINVKDNPTIGIIISDFIEDDYSSQADLGIKNYSDSIGDKVHQLVLIDYPPSNQQKAAIIKGKVKSVRDQIEKCFKRTYVHLLSVDDLPKQDLWEFYFLFYSRFFIDQRYDNPHPQVVYFFSPSRSILSSPNFTSVVQFREPGEYFFCLRSSENHDSKVALNGKYLSRNLRGSYLESKSMNVNRFEKWTILNTADSILFSLENLQPGEEVYLEIFKWNKLENSIFKKQVLLKTRKLLTEDRAVLLILGIIICYLLLLITLTRLSFKFIKYSKAKDVEAFFSLRLCIKIFVLLALSYLFISFWPLVSLPFHVLKYALGIIIFGFYIEFYFLNRLFSKKYSDGSK